MDGRKRTVQIKFRVTEAERDLILEKMKLVPTRNMEAYLRKMAIDGYIIQVDHTDIKAMTAEIQKTAESEQTADALKSVEKRLADMAVLMKHVATYQKTKPVYDAYRKAKSKERYRAGHERDIILHEAAAKALKAAGITKLPNPAALQKEYEALQAQKEVLYADYGKLKKKVREYDVIKQNIDSILQTGKQPERGKEAERG